MGDNNSASQETRLVLVFSGTDHIALFMCPELRNCVFGTIFGPSFILTLPFIFFLFYAPLLLISLFSTLL